MIKKYNNLSFNVGIPGLFVQLYGTMTAWPLMQIAGTLILLVAFYFYARSRNRHPAFCLLGLLSIFGLLILASLKDKSLAEGEEPEKGNSRGFLIFIAILVLLCFAIPFVSSIAAI